MTDKLDDVFLLLDRKKGVINAIVSAVLVYLLSASLIDKNLALLIQTIMLALTGGAEGITKSAIKAETNLGRAIINKRVEKASK